MDEIFKSLAMNQPQSFIKIFKNDLRQEVIFHLSSEKIFAQVNGEVAYATKLKDKLSTG